jgi:3-deoxy-D-arabino-heptulosonate 7-phosphate (DAHP) synthase
MAIPQIPQKTDLGWIIEIPTEMAQSMEVEEGSIAILHAKAGTIEVEVIPPPSKELDRSVNRILGKYSEAFEEMHRLGD